MMISFDEWGVITDTGAVGITGRVNPDTGRSYKYFTSSEQSLRDLLEHRIGIRVLLENDTRICLPTGTERNNE